MKPMIDHCVPVPVEEDEISLVDHIEPSEGMEDCNALHGSDPKVLRSL